MVEIWRTILRNAGKVKEKAGEDTGGKTMCERKGHN
jgi:hypothetical protein